MIILLIFVIAVTISANPNDTTQYECGAHGRFEYCIDGIPGCIIGCHCHPGYYFDTDTKICEPNSKLFHSYRRQYAFEPTRTPISQMDSPEVIEQVTPFPTVDALDDHVDSIAKNADDLGDWLYNQFYKTIESQVINKTNHNGISRRSGNRPEIKIIKKNRHKYENKNSKRRKLKKNDLRRKLLRITEDDSLFDSETETDSSDTSSSKEQSESKDNEHGHKKFVILNKKPKPPLPSFIFLPNIETPFYPPVGLPPPVLPMYPMVPVPPVVPAYPFPNVSPDCDQNQTVAGTSTTSLYTTLSVITTSSEKFVTTESTSTHLTTVYITSTHTESPNTENKNNLRTKMRKKKNLRSNGDDALRRLRQLVQNSAFIKQHKTRTFPPELRHRESLEIDDTLQVEQISNEDSKQESNNKNPSLEENTANFKYLSQLIHRIDLNDTEKLLAPKLKQNIKNIKPLSTYQGKSSKFISKTEEPARRFNFQKYPQNIKTSDTFYSNLGKQIATIIRDVDSKNDRQIDIEIEHMDQNTPNYPIFNELSYAPHSYWERFARSPINYLEQYRNNNDNRSNEVLYNIESIVKNAASTMPPMTLQEIENFINDVKKSEDKVQQKGSRKYQFYNNTLNINLWPQDLLTIKATVNPAIPYAKDIHQYSNNTKKYTTENTFRSNAKAIRMIATWLTTERSVHNVPRNKIQANKLDSAINDGKKKVFVGNVEIPNTNFEHKKISSYANMPMDLNPTAIRRANKPYAIRQPLSHLFDYNNKRFNVKYQYPFYNNLLEFKFPTVEKQVNVPFLRTKSPSYFQHEERHFDYID